MLLGELTSVSQCAIVTLAHYSWYEKIKCNTTVTAKPSIICHSQFKFGCRLGFDRALCKSTVTLLIQVVAAQATQHIYSIPTVIIYMYLCLTYMFVLCVIVFNIIWKWYTALKSDAAKMLERLQTYPAGKKTNDYCFIDVSCCLMLFLVKSIHHQTKLSSASS